MTGISPLLIYFFAFSAFGASITFDNNDLHRDKAFSVTYLDQVETVSKKYLPKGPQTSWMRAFPDEAEQSFTGYILDLNPEFTAEHAKRSRLPDPTIYVVPSLSEKSREKEEMLKKTAELLSIFYGAKVVLLDNKTILNLKKNAKGQINATDLVDFKLESILTDAQMANGIAFVSVVDSDLTDGDLNFVFGLTSETHPTLVWSTKRMGTGDKLIERALKISAHELGHVFMLPHSRAYRCIMNGYNNLEDLDSSPLEHCPSDSKKMNYLRSLEVQKRYERLIAWATKNNVLSREVGIWKKILEDIKKLPTDQSTTVPTLPPARRGS